MSVVTDLCMRSRDSNSFVSVKSHSFDVNQKACDMAHGFEARKRVSYHVVLKGNKKLVSHGNETRNVQKFVRQKKWPPFSIFVP